MAWAGVRVGRSSLRQVVAPERDAGQAPEKLAVTGDQTTRPHMGQSSKAIAKLGPPNSARRRP